MWTDKQPPAAPKPELSRPTETTTWEGKISKAKAKQAIRDQKRHAKRQAEWSTKSEAQRQQIKLQVKTQQNRRDEVFVCDFCNVFEGTFEVVSKHERTCKTRRERGWENIRINEAGWEYEEPAEDPADNDEAADAAPSQDELEGAPTKAGRRKAAKRSIKMFRACGDCICGLNRVGIPRMGSILTQIEGINLK